MTVAARGSPCALPPTPSGGAEVPWMHVSAVAGVQVMLTQPVGRSPDLGVTHMATLRWDAAGQPQLALHANALWRGVVLQPRRGGWPPGLVPPAAGGAAPPPLLIV